MVSVGCGMMERVHWLCFTPTFPSATPSQPDLTSQLAERPSQDEVPPLAELQIGNRKARVPCGAWGNRETNRARSQTHPNHPREYQRTPQSQWGRRNPDLVLRQGGYLHLEPAGPTGQQFLEPIRKKGNCWCIPDGCMVSRASNSVPCNFL